MQIVVTGSIAYDYLMTFPGKFSEHLLADSLHKLSVSFLVDSMRRQRGGVAPNIAYTMALLGGRPRIMATAGVDFVDYRQWLEGHGVDTSGVVILEDEFCASFFVNTDLDQNQIASFYSGAMSRAKNLSFAVYAPDVDLAIISPNDPAAMGAYVNECKASGIKYVYDPSQQIIRLSADELVEGLAGCFLLTVNDYELCMIEQKTGLNRESIRDMVGTMLLTLGKDGSQIFTGDSVIHIPAVLPRHIADPTGAGDAFRGGLLRGLQLELPWEVVGRIGSLAAAYVLEHTGTQGHYYTIEEFITRYRETFGEDESINRLMEVQIDYSQ